ncbi:hypothetical protein HGRIS_014258 [Hohenbuehelia grisea]|uniref:Uncharacterized protein n=1 Tax=Hohenbuehelia grisea TaxID=104357 RepID=A0ABR3JUT6_9AGAR
MQDPYAAFARSPMSSASGTLATEHDEQASHIPELDRPKLKKISKQRHKALDRHSSRLRPIVAVRIKNRYTTRVSSSPASSASNAVAERDEESHRPDPVRIALEEDLKKQHTALDHLSSRLGTVIQALHALGVSAMSLRFESHICKSQPTYEYFLENPS